MSSINSPYYQGNINEEYEFDDDNIEDFYYENNNTNNHQPQFESDEAANSDTDEASESEYTTSHHHNRNHDEPIEIKELMYQDKLLSLKRQIDELKSGVHNEYVRRVKKLEYQYKERLRLNEVDRDYLMECVDRDFISEKKAAAKEYDEKKADLKENLITDFEDRRKLIESERHTMELTGDTADVKPTVTRKLRRRPNEPIPVAAEKRRKPPSGQLVLILEEKEVENDLKLISRNKPLTPIRPPSVTSNGVAGAGMTNILNSGNVGSSSSIETFRLVETKIEDGKLLYERRWFHRGQPVYIEGKDISKFPATISGIGNDIIWVKKLNNDSNKIKIHTAQLSRGKIAIKRRAN